MSEEAVVEAIADSSQAAEQSDSGFDVESVSNDLAADLFPDHEPSNEPEPEQSAEPEVESEPVAEQEPEIVSTAPKSWPKEMHDHWAKMPKETQDYWVVREKQMLDGLEQYKGDAGFAKQVKEAMNPYMATINALGVDAPTAIRSLLNADHQLRVGSPSQKAQYFQHLAKQYGVDLSGSVEDHPELQKIHDPRLTQLQDELHGLKQIIQSGNQQQLDEQRNKIQNEVNSFASDPKHMYFDEVSEEIVALLKNGATLEDAYEKAVWANPVTRQKELMRVQTEQTNQFKAKAIAEAEAKKKAASVNLRNRDSQRTPTGPRATMSGLDSALRETMREIKSRH